MTAAAVSSAPVTSWWYGQGHAVDVVRRLESLYALSPPPAAPAGIVTARHDEVTVTFVAGLKAPLPHPWRPAESANEARIPCAAIGPDLEPDPEHPVYLVVFGTTDDGALVALNLAAFQRIRIDGDADTTTALVSRWVLELLATHPDITIGVTEDVWGGPLTSRVRPVTVGRVPQVDVLVCGPDLSYTDRSHIVSSAASKIMIDLGRDAALDTRWTISCGPDRLGQISNGSTRPMTATVIVPSSATVDRCAELLTAPNAPRPAEAGAPAAAAVPDSAAEPDPEPIAPQPSVIEAHECAAAELTTGATEPDPETAGESIDFFASPAGATGEAETALHEASQWPEPEPPAAESDPQRDTAATASTEAAGPPPSAVAPHSDISADPGTPAAAAPTITPIWNRILGQIALCPPHSSQQPGPREKRLNELTVFLQCNPWVTSSEIIRAVYGGAAAEKTVTQQLSLLRSRLGVIHAGGPKALPAQSDGGYHLDSAVRSDWMEFERLVEIMIETTPTENLVAAMELVTGPLLGGVTPKEWAWTKDLRDEIRDRVAGAAVTLAGRHHAARNYPGAVEIARKGLWYDTARQDLWQVGMQAALDGHDKDAFRALRAQYLSAVAGADRDPAVFDLTRQAG